MKKKVVSLLLAICLVCGLMGNLGPVACAEEYKGLCGEDVRWVLDTGKKELRISGTGPMADYGIGIGTSPWKQYSENIKHLVVEAGVTYIGASAFEELFSLESAELPDTVTSIGERAFYMASGDTAFDCNIPSQITSIGPSAFAWTDLTSVMLPETLAELGEGAFEECHRLATVSIPRSLKTIPKETFEKCESLVNLTLPEGIETIGEWAFSNTALKRLVVPSTVRAIGGYAFAKCEELKTAVMLCDGLTYLSEGLFSDCTSLERIKLPANLQGVYTFVFSGCKSLTRLDYPVTTTLFSYGAHNDTDSLKFITFGASEITLDENNYLFGDPSKVTLYSQSPSVIKDYAIRRGHDWQPLGSEPEDDWDPNAEPTPTPGPTQDPTPTPGNPTPEPADRFTDVSAKHYARKAINWAVTKKVVSGMTANTFGVGKKCDRSQAVFFIWAAQGRPEPTLTQNPFTDVKSGAYYYKAVLWAKENNITGGKTATTFDPTGNVTRGQIMTFLYAAQGRPSVSGSKSFTDVKPSDYYSKAVAWAAENGISSGKGAGTFKPKDNCKREEIVTFLYQAYK